jgi:hypothetical protein
MKDTITCKLNRIQRSLDAIEAGRFAEFSASYCADYLSWCYRYKKEHRQRALQMVKQLTMIFESGIN